MHSCSIHNAYKCNLNQKDISPQNALTSGICEESSLEENGYERNHFVGRAAEQNAARQKHLSFRMSDTKCFVSLSPPLSSLHLDQQDREIFFFFPNERTLYHGTLACLWAGLGWVCVRVLGPEQDICLTLTLSLLSPHLCVASHT